MSTRSRLRLALLVFTPGLAHGQATVFHGAAGSPGDVWIHPAPGALPQRPPELQGIVLLPLDVVGRAEFTQFQPDRARRIRDIPLASRLLLPQGQGALYRFGRSGDAGTEFGYFLVPPTGLARFLAAFPGAGPSGDQDPIPNPVALASRGDALLVATSLAAGGDVHELDLASGALRLLSAGLPPLDVLPQGLVLLDDWGAVLTSRGPFRYARGSGELSPVRLRANATPGVLGQNGGAPALPLAHFGDGLVASADGSTVALVAGASPSLAFVFTFERSGSATCVNDAPAPIVAPGSAGAAGPSLALAPDGGRVAWKTVTQSGECFTRRVPKQPTPPEFQITHDLHFADTLDDTGVIAFFDRDSVVMLVGEPNGVGGIERGDFYRADFPAGGGAPALTNLTMTSGDATAPFLFKGEIESSDGVYLLPGQDGIVYFVDASSGQGSVQRLDGGSGTVTLVRDRVARLDFAAQAGADLVLGLLRSQPSVRELVRVPAAAAQPATVLGTFPSTSTFFAHAGDATGTFAGALNVPGGQRMLQVHVPTGQGALWPDVLQCSPVLGFDGAGAVLATVRTPQRAWFVAWAAGTGGALYGTGPRDGFVLPGN